MSNQTPDPEPTLHPRPHRKTIYRARHPPSGLPSAQTLAQGLPQTLLPEQPAAVIHLQRWRDYRGSCWLAHMFQQHLPRRRRLCDGPNQVHPPTAPAALERKSHGATRPQLRAVFG